MRQMLRRFAPLAASLVAHTALIAAVAAAGRFAGPAVGAGAQVIPVRREPEAAPAPGPRLRLETTAGEERATPAPEEAAVPLDTADPRYRSYLSGVKRRIWERWEAPGLPEGPPARGALVLEFTLTRGGRLAESAVRETSGVPALDRAALEAVARAGPFTPLPASILGESMRVRARFVYD